MSDQPILRWHVELTTEERDALLTQLLIRRVNQPKILESGRLLDSASYVKRTELLGRAEQAISAGHMVWYKSDEDPDQWRRPRDGRRSAETADSERHSEPGKPGDGS